MVIPRDPLWFAAAFAVGLAVLRAVLSAKALVYHLRRAWRWLDDKTQAYQYYKIPRCTQSYQENALYRKAAIYVSSLNSLEDSDEITVASDGRKPNDAALLLDPGQSAGDSFLGARLLWTNLGLPGGDGDCLALRLRRQDRIRVLRPYLQHVEAVADEIELRRRELRLYTNLAGAGGRWRSVPFTHPATLDTVAMDPELKQRVRADLESFLKGRAYYHRLGRVWRRSYLLYGPPGTGKSTFVAAMAKFLGFDIYDLDLARVADGADLRALLLQTTPLSVILVEDIDRYLSGNEPNPPVTASSAARVTGILGFMDGIFSSCGEERIMVFTASGAGGGDGKEGLDPAVLRPGRLDVHIHFPMCDFSAFKTLANNYLGLRDHKLYPQVEEGFQSGAKLSPAEVGEIMIANRGSPSRALKTVISALQQAAAASRGRAGRLAAVAEQRLSESLSGRRSEETTAASEACSGGGAGLHFGKEPMKEFKKLYGFIKMRGGSKREGVMPVEVAAAAAAAGSKLDKDW